MQPAGKHSLRIILFFGILVTGIQLVTAQRQIPVAAEFLKKNGRAGEYMIGPPTSFTLCFLSPVSPLYYVDEALKSRDTLKLRSVQWFGAISNPHESTAVIDSHLLEVRRHLQDDFADKTIFPVYNSNETAVIIKR
jgi:hypothetical protein